jgi:hypothetical protein
VVPQIPAHTLARVEKLLPVGENLRVAHEHPEGRLRIRPWQP